MQLPDFRLPEIKTPNVKVPSLQLPRVRLPRLHGGPRRRGLRVHGLRRPRLDVENPERLSAHLQFFFYLLMFVSLLAIFAGATGTGVLALIVGAALHVLRSSLAEVAARREARRERAERKQVRLRSHRAARQAREADGVRVTKAPPRAAAPRPAATASARASAPRAPAAPPAPRLSTRRRPAVAQPGPSPARKQRVI